MQFCDFIISKRGEICSLEKNNSSIYSDDKSLYFPDTFSSTVVEGKPLSTVFFL